MVHLVQGDRLPMVAVVQAMLNSWNLRRHLLTVDGVFGSLTRSEVVYFQQHQGITPSGQVQQNTWQQLTQHNRMVISDLVDVSDSLLEGSVTVLRNNGSMPLEIGRMSNATAGITSRILSSGVERGKLVLLRFHGHGNHGSQVIGYGTGCHVFFETFRRGETMIFF